jgi:hypothetical protein
MGYLGRDLVVKLTKEDYGQNLGRTVMGITEAIRRNQYGMMEEMRKRPGHEHDNLDPILFASDKNFLFEITPSIDSQIGPHFDINSYALVKDDEYRLFTRATALAQKFGDYTRERAGWARALIDAGGMLRFLCEDEEYLVTLKREITQMNSAAIVAQHFRMVDLPTSVTR